MMPGHEKRVLSLDGLRGLAALIVFLYHVDIMVKPFGAGGPSLFPGTASVMVFFILSGIVLSLVPFKHMGTAGTTGLAITQGGSSAFAGRCLRRLRWPFLWATWPGAWGPRRAPRLPSPTTQAFPLRFMTSSCSSTCCSTCPMASTTSLARSSSALTLPSGP